VQDPILGITENYLADPDKQKINLGVVSLPSCQGVYA
jgi:aspartate/tyrosine/aromatic aminotransferase